MQSSTAFPGWILRGQFSGDAKLYIIRVTNVLAILVIVVRSNLKISLFCSFFIVLFWAAAVASKSHFGLLIFLKNFVSCDAVVSTPWLTCSSRQCCSFSSKAVRLSRRLWGALSQVQTCSFKCLFHYHARYFLPSCLQATSPQCQAWPAGVLCLLLAGLRGFSHCGVMVFIF